MGESCKNDSRYLFADHENKETLIFREYHIPQLQVTDGAYQITFLLKIMNFF